MVGDMRDETTPFMVRRDLFRDGDSAENGWAMMPFSVAWDLPSAYRGGFYGFATGSIPVGYLESEPQGVGLCAVCDDGSTVALRIRIRVWDHRRKAQFPTDSGKWVGSGYLHVDGGVESFECVFSADSESLRRDVEQEVAIVRRGIAAGKIPNVAELLDESPEKRARSNIHSDDD